MNWRVAFVLVACAAALVAQTPPVSVLNIEVEKAVLYWEDNPDMSKWGKLPGPVTPVLDNPNVALKSRVLIGDIVSVNGKPARGTFHAVGRNFLGTQELVPGRAIADWGGCVWNLWWVILNPDGTLIGSILASGHGSSSPPPGAPSSLGPGLRAVIGGTGAFLGARGQSGVKGTTRAASITEDPAYRRVNSGGNTTYSIQLIPMTWPEVLIIPTGPAIFHGDDFSPVTAEKPARAGEVVIMSVSGLGPVRPNLDPGKPFPPLAEAKVHAVNSPVDVTVNGEAAQVINALGWPGMTNVYRVDFRVPEGTAAGMATLGLAVAWINGPEVKFPVR
jgi:uncharacterized protein (TIGR03437 family)